MMQQIFFHYLMLNVLLTLGYIGTRFLRKFSGTQRISFKQELKITRFLLFYIPCVYCIIFLFKYLHPEHAFLFQMPETGSANLSISGNIFSVGTAKAFNLSEYCYIAFMILIIAAATFRILNFVRQLVQLKRIILNGIVIKKYHDLSIVLSDVIPTPFC